MNESRPSLRKSDDNDDDLRPAFEKWSDIHERKSLVSIISDLLLTAALRDYSIVVTGLFLLGLGWLILHYNPHPEGILGATAVALLLMVMGLARTNAQNSKEQIEPPTQSRNESSSPREPGTTA